MIYLRNTMQQQVIFIPRGNARDNVWKVTFHAKSTICDCEFSHDTVVNCHHSMYYMFPIKLTEGISSGEYEYTLSDEMGILSTGLLVIGEIESDVEYVNNEEYEQYNN